MKVVLAWYYIGIQCSVVTALRMRDISVVAVCVEVSLLGILGGNCLSSGKFCPVAVLSLVLDEGRLSL